MFDGSYRDVETSELTMTSCDSELFAVGQSTSDQELLKISQQEKKNQPETGE